jgi:hypothetical protein
VHSEGDVDQHRHLGGFIVSEPVEKLRRAPSTLLLRIDRIVIKNLDTGQRAVAGPRHHAETLGLGQIHDPLKFASFHII